MAFIGEEFEELFSSASAFIIDPYAFRKKGYFPVRSFEDLEDFKKRFSQLKRSGYLEKKGNKFLVTPKGRERIIKLIVKRKKIKEGNKWDGKWRGIIFDIPELSRRERDLLRRELKWVGFRELQKSIWIYPFNVEKELKSLLRLWKLDLKGDIRFILIEKMNDKDLKKAFGLEKNR